MGRLRGWLWFAAGLVVAILAAALAVVVINREIARRAPEQDVTPRDEVVVAARFIDVRTQLTAEDLEMREVPEDAIPETAVRNLEQVVGKLTTVDLYLGEFILSGRLLDPNVITEDGRMALVVAEDEVLMAFPADDLINKVGVLKAGDHVDILFSYSFPVGVVIGGGVPRGDEGEEQVTYTLLENISIAAVVRPEEGGEAEAILLTISPQDALALKFMKDAGATPDFVLRAPGVEEPFETEPVDIDYLINRYLIPVEVGP